MFENLQRKWKVSGGRLILILLTFAIGGSLTGYFGKQLMQFTGISDKAVYIIIYIILITIIWPLMVLIVSIPFGQFAFFKAYIAKIGKRITGRKRLEKNDASGQIAAELKKTARHDKIELNQTSSTQNPKLLRPPKRSEGGKTQNPKRVAIFASGAGSNAQKIINHFKNSPVADIVLIVCNKAGAGVIGIAENENIPLLMIERERFLKGDVYVPELRNAFIDLIVLAGFLWKIPDQLIRSFPERIINIHPALLPSYGGKGMYGHHVHAAVLSAGEVQSGITVHYVDEHYDHGDVIFQTACPVLEGDTAESLAKRIHELEYAHYPMVIEKLLADLDSNDWSQSSQSLH